ncbi:MAG: 4Fe-4S binding protein, partial [Planctomycetaceae bacterium]|nr:4Fe-4S binding protein [Planctomycetaceae bacterium]
MTKLDDHPSVVRFRQSEPRPHPGRIDVERLRRICLDAGADDVGFVGIDRHELDDQRAEILGHFPWTKGLISLACRMNREPIRSPARSVANLEFHHVGDHINEVASKIVSVLEAEGVRAVNPSMGFPMEVDRFPDKVWVVSHKPVAVAAGLGQMGVHRNVIHPKFGNFILLATVLIDAEIAEQSQPIDYNPCLECKLCVAACPVGAIAPDGHFDFS